MPHKVGGVCPGAQVFLHNFIGGNLLTVQQRFLALALGCLITVSVVANPLYPKCHPQSWTIYTVAPQKVQPYNANGRQLSDV